MRTIRELREAAGMSQRELARRAEISYNTVYLWEQGKHAPRADALRRVAVVFGVCSDDIVLPGDEGNDVI